MLRETGLEDNLPLSDEMKEQIISQYIEYKILEKRLGSAARMTIAPIVKYDPAEYKALEDLRAECKKFYPADGRSHLHSLALVIRLLRRYNPTVYALRHLCFRWKKVPFLGCLKNSLYLCGCIHYLFDYGSYI